jgi:excisionase family DNA binding protein
VWLCVVDKLYTIPEVAEIIKCSRRGVEEWIKSGKLKHVKIGRLIRIKEKDLQNFIDGK